MWVGVISTVIDGLRTNASGVFRACAGALPRLKVGTNLLVRRVDAIKGLTSTDSIGKIFLEAITALAEVSHVGRQVARNDSDTVAIADNNITRINCHVDAGDWHLK